MSNPCPKCDEGNPELSCICEPLGPVVVYGPTTTFTFQELLANAQWLIRFGILSEDDLKAIIHEHDQDSAKKND